VTFGHCNLSGDFSVANIFLDVEDLKNILSEFEKIEPLIVHDGTNFIELDNEILDPKGLIYLGRAIFSIGKAKYGEGWLNDENLRNNISKLIGEKLLQEELRHKLIQPWNGIILEGKPALFATNRWAEYVDEHKVYLDDGYANIFLVQEDFDKFINELENPKAEVSKNEPWHPAENETCKAWCARKEVRDEGLRRAKPVFGRNPKQINEAQTLSTMWLEIKNEIIQLKTIEQYLIAINNAKKGG
jgi:hypothetical protein